MNDKIPRKYTGFFIALVGTGMILSFLSRVIDRLLFQNSDFSILEYENFEPYMFGLSLSVAVFWLVKVKDMKN